LGARKAQSRRHGVSADNWAICPKCLAVAQDKRASEERRVAGLYGKVSVEDFDAARTSLVEVRPEDFRTFREDYGFSGAEAGEIEAEYVGGCRTCGLEVRLAASKSFWPEAAS